MWMHLITCVCMHMSENEMYIPWFFVRCVDDIYIFTFSREYYDWHRWVRCPEYSELYLLLWAIDSFFVSVLYVLNEWCCEWMWCKLFKLEGVCGMSMTEIPSSSLWVWSWSVGARSRLFLEAAGTNFYLFCPSTSSSTSLCHHHHHHHQELRHTIVIVVAAVNQPTE